MDLLHVFDERELELLIGGMSEIDMCVFNPLLAPSYPLTTLLQGRLDQVHRLPRLREDRPGDRVVLAVHPFLAGGAQVAATTVHYGHVARAGQWLQRPSGLGRPTAVHDREVGRPGGPAAKPYVLQSAGSAAVYGL